MVVGARAIAGRLFSFPWRRWVKAEQNQVLEGENPTGRPWGLLVLMGSVLGLFLVLVFLVLVAAAGLAAPVPLLAGPPLELIGVVPVLIAFGIGFELLLPLLPEALRKRAAKKETASKS